jgi:hypothetical protein
MAILFSGDFHANSVGELNVINKESLLKKYRLEIYNKIHYHIILGDGGFLWPNNQQADENNFMELACRPFPVLCVIGNHEPILGIDNFPETDIGIGETVYQIRGNPFVAYLKRGKVYTIDGFKILVLGGALSIDKGYRKPNITWWEREYWSQKEKQDVLTLIKTENVFDCVISHTGPDRINKMLFQYPAFFPKLMQDEVAFLNDQIDGQIQYRDWWCGHWHHDVYHYDINAKKGYQYLYRTTKILDREDNQMIVFNEDEMTAR